MTELSPENKIINGLWISPDGKPLSNLERLSIYSFCAHGHDFRLWTYGDFPNVPQDTAPGKVEVRDGNEIIPGDRIFRRKGRLSHFSDWFRMELISRFGGWYTDVDVVCLRPFAFDEDIVLISDGKDVISPGFMKFPKEHFAMSALADACANPNRIVPWDDRRRLRRKRIRRLAFWQNPHEQETWGEAGGPPGFTLAMKHFGLTDKVKPSWYCNFVGLAGPEYLISGDLHEIGVLQPLLNHAYSIHCFNSNFLGLKWDKNGTFHPNSPFEILKRRYLPELKEKP